MGLRLTNCELPSTRGGNSFEGVYDTVGHSQSRSYEHMAERQADAVVIETPSHSEASGVDHTLRRSGYAANVSICITSSGTCSRDFRGSTILVPAAPLRCHLRELSGFVWAILKVLAHSFACTGPQRVLLRSLLPLAPNPYEAATMFSRPSEHRNPGQFHLVVIITLLPR